MMYRQNIFTLKSAFLYIHVCKVCLILYYLIPSPLKPHTNYGRDFQCVRLPNQNPRLQILVLFCDKYNTLLSSRLVNL